TGQVGVSLTVGRRGGLGGAAPGRLPSRRRTRRQMGTLQTRLEGPILIEPDVLGDERGFFCETYRRNVFSELGIAEEMVQDNQSRSMRGVVRGLHFQIGAG